MSGHEANERAGSVGHEITGILGRRKDSGRNVGLILITLLIVAATAAYLYVRAQSSLGSYHTATVKTSKGVFILQLYPRAAPQTVSSFERLVEAGFYDGLQWHRVDDWIVQTGESASAGRDSDSGYSIPFEANPKLPNRRGSVGAARPADQDLASTQWYILKMDTPWLDSKYTVYGKVVSGMEVVDQLVSGDKVLHIEIHSRDR